MKTIYAIFLLIATLNCTAQYRDLHFEHLTVEDGLSYNGINALIQDKSGYMWLGLPGNIVRYDGYQIRSYKTEGDLLCVDAKGTVWAGANGQGLYRYDPVIDSFVLSRHVARYNGNSKNFNKIIADQNGGLWLSYGFDPSKPGEPGNYGLEFFDTKTGSVKRFPFFVSSMLISSSGVPWFGTTKGLVYYDYGTGKMCKPFVPRQLKTLFIEGLYQAPSEPGALWFALFDTPFEGGPRPGFGLWRFDVSRHTFRQYANKHDDPNSIVADYVIKIHEDHRHRFWLGTAKGLSLLDRKTGQFRNFSLPSADTGEMRFQDFVSEIQERHDGQFWLASGYGIWLFNPENNEFNHYAPDSKKPYSLATHYIQQMYTDRSGLLWVALYYGGLDRINTLRSSFDLYEADAARKDSYPTINDAYGVVQAPDGTCWLGSELEGLVKWIPNTDVFQRVKLPSIMARGKDLDVLYADRDGLIWCRLRSGAIPLFTYDPKTGVVDTFKNSSPFPAGSFITAVYMDHNGTVWIGANRKGLHSYDKKTGKFTAYPYIDNQEGNTYSGNKLDAKSIYTIYEDMEGTLWIGTNQGGLNRYNRKEGTFTSFFDNRIGMASICAIYEDHQHRFWVGSTDNGLFLFDRKTGKSRHFTERDGLSQASVAGIMEDHHGRLWINSERGLSVLGPQGYNFDHYNTKNALPFSDVAFGHIKTIDNEFIYLGVKGMIAFYPDRIEKNTTPPGVEIESMTCSDPRVKGDTGIRIRLSGKKEIEFSYDQNRLAFNYVGLHYINSSLNHYAYRLVGYDNNWIQAGTQRSITYTNLSPGTYTFLVKASNSDGIWNETGASVKIIIHSPWWFTWWAWTIYVLLFGAAVYNYVNFRSRKLIRENQQLEEQVQARTRQLTDANNQLHEQQEEIKTQRDDLATQKNNLEVTLGELKSTQTQLIQREKMASLGELTAGIAHEIQNPLNFVNNFSEISVELMDEMSEELAKGDMEEVKAIVTDVKENLDKIHHHGQRAGAIVKGMLEHSRNSTGRKELTNINALTDEYLKLSYHGFRAKDKDFQADMVINFDTDLPQISAVQQDLGRVFLNLFNNAFYAVNQKRKAAPGNYNPEVSVSTSKKDNTILVIVKDNGIGIPEKIKDKIMQPFFTTKPTGEGTGLGLSLSYDTVVKGHNGEIIVNSTEGEFTEFILKLPFQ